MGFNENVRSTGYKNFMDKLYGIGAAIVIIGALFKINHFPGANILLIFGMGMEAIIFAFSAFEPLHTEYDWSLVYPELAGMEGEHGVPRTRPDVVVTAKKDALSEKLDSMLAEANIDSSLLESLSVGLNKLSTTTQNLNSIVDVANINKAYTSELEKLTSNLVSLNNMYESQLKASTMQIEASLKAQNEMTQIISNLGSTIESSEKYKQEVKDLSDKVSSLNKIYSNMLSAMGKA